MIVSVFARACEVRSTEALRTSRPAHWRDVPGAHSWQHRPQSSRRTTTRSHLVWLITTATTWVSTPTPDSA